MHQAHDDKFNSNTHMFRTSGKPFFLQPSSKGHSTHIDENAVQLGSAVELGLS